MFESEYAKCEFMEKDRAVLHVWKKEAHYDDYRAPVKASLEMLKEHAGSVFIVDARNGFEDVKEDVEWGFSYFLPELKKTGCKFWGFILPKVSDIEGEIDLWTQEIEKNFRVIRGESYADVLDKILHENVIVEKMRQEIIRRSDLFEEQTRGTKDEYNLYREHVQYVYKYAVMLSKDADIDKEIVELSALLHDISMTDASLDRSKHNEFSSAMAEQLLREQHYPEEKLQLVAKCILNHSSKRAQYRTTREEDLLACADGLAHFDAYKSLYSLAHKVMGLDDEQSLKFIQDKLTKDYAEISEELKYLVSDVYARVMEAKTIQEILDPSEFDQ